MEWKENETGGFDIFYDLTSEEAEKFRNYMENYMEAYGPISPEELKNADGYMFEGEEVTGGDESIRFSNIYSGDLIGWENTDEIPDFDSGSDI